MPPKQAAAAELAFSSKPHATELAEVLDVEAHVDMSRLLSLCSHGVPERLRAEAWKYMLGVSRPERSEEMSLHKRMGIEYADLERACRADANDELARAVKAEVKPHRTEQGGLSWDARTRGRLEGILRCYLHAEGEELTPGVVHLLCPFVHVFGTDVEAYACFHELMKRIGGEGFEGTKAMAVTFMTLLRHTLPELYGFFEEVRSHDTAQCSAGHPPTSPHPTPTPTSDGRCSAPAGRGSPFGCSAQVHTSALT